MKVPILPAAIALCMFLLMSCTNKTADEQPSAPNGGTARISLQSANDILFPLLIQESNLRQISEYMLNPTLTSYDGFANPKEVLASAWQVGAGNRSVTYILNSAYRWNDGKRLSTEDIAFTFAVMQVPYFRERMAEQFKVIRDIEIIDSLSFRINFSRPVAEPFYHTKIPVMPAGWAKFLSEPGALQEVYQQEFLGCGPFILKHSSRDSLVLEKNPYYPGEYPRLEKVVIYFYAGDDHLAGRIRGSGAELFVDIPISLINIIRASPGYEIRTYPERGYSFVAWNLKKEPFNEHMMRRALSMAIDRDALINGVLAGYGRKIEGPVYPALEDRNDTLPQIFYDPQQAERMLDEIGWLLDESSGIRMRNGRKLAFSLMINRENPIRKEIALNIKANLAAIGAQVQIDIVDWQKIRQAIRNKSFDALLLTWVDESYYEPSQIFHSAGTVYGLNMMSYRDAAADSLIEAGLNATDPDVRKKTWQQFQQIVARDLPVTFLYNQEILCAIKKSLHDVQITADGYLISVKEWWTSER